MKYLLSSIFSVVLFSSISNAQQSPIIIQQRSCVNGNCAIPMTVTANQSPTTCVNGNCSVATPIIMNNLSTRVRYRERTRLFFRR